MLEVREEMQDKKSTTNNKQCNRMSFRSLTWRMECVRRANVIGVTCKKKIYIATLPPALNQNQTIYN